jgi:glycosyltransferase involved in cell wall biosynthesis
LTDNGRCALLFPPGDAAAMSRAIAGIGETDRRALAARVRSHFNAELSYPALARVFDTTLAGVLAS